MAAYFTPDFLQFLAELEQNNNRPWFEANKKRFEENLKKPFQRFVEDLQEGVLKMDPQFQPQAANTLPYRIYRDTRFSKDKTPYKNHLGAYLCQRGKKAEWPGFYFHFSAEGAMLACGMYEVQPPTLKRIREFIAHNPLEFKTIVDSPGFHSRWGELKGEKGKVLPAELKEAAGAEPRLYHKQFYFAVERPAETVFSENLLTDMLEYYRSAMPYHAFLAEALAF